MNDNGDNIVNFPMSIDELEITIVQDSERKKVAIVVSGFNSVDEAVAFLED